MKKLSTGEDATLGNYLVLAKLLFSESAVKFLEDKIVDQGAGEEVLMDERQMIQLLASL